MDHFFSIYLERGRPWIGLEMGDRDRVKFLVPDICFGM